jgi:hypothetical protein
MARPTQNTIDYFSHDCNHKQTMYILENKYKNDGYAFWFKLLESLGSAPNHFLDLNDEIACEFLAAKTNLNWSSCDEILTLLAKINAICPELWSKKIVWCQKFVDRLSGVYAKRKSQIPDKPSYCDGNDSITVFSDAETLQSKVKESKVKESKVKESIKDKRIVCNDAETFKKHDVEISLPNNLQTPAFKAAWESWLQYRKERRSKITPSTQAKQLKELSAMGEQRAIASIEQSIRNGWLGLFSACKNGKADGSWLEDLKNLDVTGELEL